MTFFQAINTCFKNYSIFRGRSTRSEYWNWRLFELLLVLIAIRLDFTIFKESEESYFRNIERDIINQFKNKKCVYSTGGGLPIYNKNIHKLKDIGQVIYLKTSIGELLNNRINNNSSRPMFQDAISFENLLKQREPIYCEADFVVTTDSKTPEEIASEISLLIA